MKYILSIELICEGETFVPFARYVFDAFSKYDYQVLLLGYRPKVNSQILRIIIRVPIFKLSKLK